MDLIAARGLTILTTTVTLNTHARQAACVHTETKDSRQQQNCAKTYTNEFHDNKVRSHSSQNQKEKKTFLGLN